MFEVSSNCECLVFSSSSENAILRIRKSSSLVNLMSRKNCRVVNNQSPLSICGAIIWIFVNDEIGLC